MGEVVNLRRARKAKSRSDAEVAAAANRLRFGRTQAEREVEALEAGRAARLLDGARREPPVSGMPEPPASAGPEACGTDD